MSLIEIKRRAFVTLLALCCLLLTTGAVLAEGQDQAASPSTSAPALKDIDLEIRLYLVVASNAGGETAKPPAQVETALRQLSSSLPFNSYRWAGTFINRVSNGSSSSIRGVAGPLLGTTPPSSGTPSFYDLQLSNVSLRAGAAGQSLVRISLHFGARLPVTVGGGGQSAQPTVNYEGTGVNTTVSVRENEPVVVGTMSMGAANETLVLVVAARRVS